MNGKIKDIENCFWSEMDFDVSAYKIKWDTEISKDKFESEFQKFLNIYIKIAYKYGILLPHNIHISDKLAEDINTLLKEQTNFPNDWMKISFNKLYKYLDTLLFSSVLFIQKKNDIVSERIVNADLLISYNEILEGNENVYAEPVKLNFFKNYFYLTFNCDTFFEKLNNKKTSFNEEDNFSTAILNTTRFNSFLRDFIILCFQFYATDLCFEELEYENISENGILLGDRILFYEDVYDKLPEEHKYKLFEQIHITLDDTNYKKYKELSKK